MTASITVEGTVRGADGKPVPGAEVALEIDREPDASSASTVADAQGQFHLQADFDTYAGFLLGDLCHAPEVAVLCTEFPGLGSQQDRLHLPKNDDVEWTLRPVVRWGAPARWRASLSLGRIFGSCSTWVVLGIAALTGTMVWRRQFTRGRLPPLR
jgi:hypothetical protein